MLRRLGFNLLYLVPRQVGGTEVAARSFVGALGAERRDLEILVFCGREAAAELPDPAWPANVRVVGLPVRAARKAERMAAELAMLPAAAEHYRVDLLHSYGTTAPLHGRFARVTTVHDLIYHFWPGSFPPAARAALKVAVPAGVRRAHRVQVLSGATRDELTRVFGTSRAKVDVIPHGVGMHEVANAPTEATLRANLDLGNAPVLLSIAAALPHKNLGALLEAFAALRSDPASVLVLTGHTGRLLDDLRAHAQALGIAQRVRFTGWLDDAEVEGLYRLATVFVYPSLHEGFGLPVLEAMRRGTPVVSSGATSLKEVAGDGALLVDTRSIAAFADALDRVISDRRLRDELVNRGHAWSTRFSWRRSAEAALVSYDRALEAAGP